MKPALNTPHSTRLIFRTWQPDDFEAASRIFGDPEVMRYLSATGAFTEEQIRARLAFEIDCREKHGVQYWPLFEAESGKLVGCSGLKPWVHSPRGGHEMGFYLLKEMWGIGYAVEAAEAVIRFAFEERNLPSIMAGHHPENAGARKILLQLGFEYLEDVLFKPTGLMHPSYRKSRRGRPDSALRSRVKHPSKG